LTGQGGGGAGDGTGDSPGHHLSVSLVPGSLLPTILTLLTALIAL